MSEKKFELEGKMLAEAFMDSEHVAAALSQALGQFKITPLTMAFALSILEDSIVSQVPNWFTLRTVTMRAIKKMQEDGLAPTFNADGSINTSKMHEDLR